MRLHLAVLNRGNVHGVFVFSADRDNISPFYLVRNTVQRGGQEKKLFHKETNYLAWCS